MVGLVFIFDTSHDTGIGKIVHTRANESFCDPHRDEPRTRAKQILEILKSVADEENVPAVTRGEEPRRKYNPGWKKIKEFNLKRYVARQRKELGLDGPSASPPSSP